MHLSQGFSLRQVQTQEVRRGMWYQVALSALLRATSEDLADLAKREFDQEKKHHPYKGGGSRGKGLTTEEVTLLDSFREATLKQPDLIVQNEIITEKCEQYFGITPLGEDEEFFIKPFNCTFADLIKARGQLLRRIARWILTEQSEFFEGRRIVARSQEKCANAIGVDPSKVCIGIQRKTVCIHAMNRVQYTYKMPFFFCPGPTHPYYIKTWLRKKLQEEDKSKPLTDNQLIALWNSENEFQIARRTMGSWRTKNGIANHPQRKQ